VHTCEHHEAYAHMVDIMISSIICMIRT